MKRKNYDESFFEKVDSIEKAYFLGLIYSDGCLVYNPEKYLYKIYLKLHSKDKEILIRFIESIQGEMKIWDNKRRDMCEVSVSGKKIIMDLNKLGVHPNKTFTLTYPKIDENLERHFLRGYFDGDGCIRINTDKRDGSERGDLRIVGGSDEMINKINERMHILFGVNLNKPYGPKNSKFKYIGWGAMRDIEKIYNGFYSDCDLFLQRKKTTFDKVITLVRNKQKYRKKI